MTGPEHYREAERLAAQAARWMDANTGWKAHLSVGERLAYRAADLAAAQVHAALALAAATAQSAPVDDEPDSGMPPADARAWNAVAGTAGGGTGV